MGLYAVAGGFLRVAVANTWRSYAGAGEHVPPDESHHDRMPLHGRVLAKFREEIKQPGHFPDSYVSSSVEVGVPGEWRWLVSWRLGRAV
jgi:hypothetical protein